MGDDFELEKRKEKAINFLKEYSSYIQYLILAVIIWIGYKIRIQNLPFLKDITTGKYIPADPDAMGFLRYVLYILEHGKIMTVDTLRYYPLGFTGTNEFSLLSHFIVYLYKFLHFFNSSITIEYVDVIYPPIALAIALVFFFLLVRKLFNYRVALIASAFLAVIPAFLFRTMAGISDKEALGTLLMFMAFYFFIYSWKQNNIKKSLITALLAGILTALMGMVWGGVSFIFFIIGIFALIILLLNKFNNRKFYAYVVWLLSSLIILNILFPTKFPVGSLMTSLRTLLAVMVLFVYIINYLIFKRKIIKIKTKFSEIIASFIITIILGIVLILIKQGPNFFINLIMNIFTILVKPFATNRWVITVAESHQPYIQDWFSQFGKSYIWLIIIGSIFLFYEIVKELSKKDAWKLTGIYALFIFGFIFSRYSQSSLFNGETSLSIIVYLGSLLLLIFALVYYYIKIYKQKKIEDLVKLDETLIFTLIWFIVMVVAARSAIRLIFIFAPITTIIFAYFVYKTYEHSLKIKEKLYKIIIILIIIFITLSLFIGFYKDTSNQAKYVGSIYNQQWQVAGDWVRKNTLENAVFAHWWDYGYLVQTGFNRATLSDGGNARGAINHFIGRHVLTGQNNTEALELLKASNTTHLLIISDEIGKYPAFSSIGSDENYDRYSWISTFSLDTNQVKETRNGASYVYTGGTVLDEDLIYQGKLYPRRAAGIGAFIIETRNVNETLNGVNFLQPRGILVYNGQQIEVPINCIFFNNQELKFDNSNGIDACLRFIPTINGNQQNSIGALMYLSPRVKRTLITRLYLFNQQDENFKIVYNDEDSMPLAIYQGRLIGPLKIWQINYPNNLEIPKEYYGTEVPNPDVERIKPEYT